MKGVLNVCDTFAGLSPSNAAFTRFAAASVAWWFLRKLWYPSLSNFLRQLYRARLYWSSESSGLDEFTRSLWKLPTFQGACSMFRRTHHQWDVCSGLPRIRAIWWPYGVAYATGCPRPLGCQGKLVKLGAGPDHLRYIIAEVVRPGTKLAICIASCDAGGLLPAAGLQEFMPLSHYGFGCVGNKQFKHFHPGACLAAYALSCWACTSSRGVDASFASFGLFVPVFRAGGRIGHQIAFIGGWRILECTTLGRADGQSAKWTDAGSVSHFSDRARRNLEPMWTNQIGIHQCHQAHGQGWPQEYQTCHPAPPKQAQGAQGCMQPFTTQTEFHTLPQQTSKAVTHRQPSVGLQNTNNTCYMNSFMQALFLTDAFVWRIYDFTLKLKAKASKIDEEDFEFGRKVVELLQKQFAKMALTKHQHTDIWDILQAFPGDYRSGEQQDVTETIRFVFDKLGRSDQALLREVFAGQLQEKIQCRECGKIKVREETLQIWCFRCPLQSRPKRVASCQPCRSFLRSAWSVRRWTTQTIWSPVKIAKRRHSPWSGAKSLDHHHISAYASIASPLTCRPTTLPRRRRWWR